MIIKAKLTTLICAVSCVLSTISFSQTSKKNDDFDKKFDDFIQSPGRFQIQTGIAVGVVKNGEIVFQKQYGYLNVEKQMPVQPDTPFYIAFFNQIFRWFADGSIGGKGFSNLMNRLLNICRI